MDAEHWKNVMFERVLPIFKPNSSPEDDVAEEQKVEVVELIFYVVTKNVAVFDAASWKSAVLTNIQKRTF